MKAKLFNGLSLVRLLGLVGLMMLATTSYAGTCFFDIPSTDNGESAEMWAHNGADGICRSNQYQSSFTYDNLSTVDLYVTWRFHIMFPDAAPRDGASNPVRAVFTPSGGTSRSTISVATCFGATVTGAGSTFVEISLADGDTCPLRLVSNNGTEDITYTATLSRTGSVYWAAGASLVGGAFGAPDTTPPRISSITRRNPTLSPTGSDTLTWRITFDEAVRNVHALNFNWTGTTANLLVNEINAISYDVTLSGGDLADLNGTVILGFADDQNIEDMAGNPLTNTTPTGQNSNYFIVDNTAPEIDVQRPAGASIADGGTDGQGSKDAASQVTLTYTVSNTGDATLNVSNITSTSYSNVSVDSISTTSLLVAAGTTDTFSVQYTPTAGGAFSFDLDISSNDADEANYDVTVSGTGADSIPPDIEILDAPVSVANNDPFSITFEFSEDVTGFAQGDITVGNGGASGFLAQDSNTYTADITPDGNGDITIDVAASVAQDGAGNANTAAMQVSILYGHIVLPPAEGGGPGEDVGLTYSATQADGTTTISATLSLEISSSKLQTPPDEANSLVSAINITSTSSVDGYILVVTFEIEASSDNLFTGFWKYGAEASGNKPHWYDYGTLTANGDGTGYEISVDQKSLTIYLIDGVRGDNDWEVNASITDPALLIIRPPETVFQDGFESTE